VTYIKAIAFSVLGLEKKGDSTLIGGRSIRADNFSVKSEDISANASPLLEMRRGAN